MNSSDLSQTLVDSLLFDRRRDRLWRNIRFFIVIALIIAYFSLALLLGSRSHDTSLLDSHKPYVALLHLDGEIMVEKPFSADKTLPLLQQAFEDKGARAVVLVINSPGGSPVQSSIIHDKIIELKTRFHKPVIVMGVDSLASGAYLVATAADRIYVNEDTVTGSIGVLMSGFGFTDAIKKLGITRRIFTAGENKARMDPFEPITSASTQKINHVLSEVHKHFIQDVVVSRGNRLKGDPKELFSGDFWTGSEAVTLGLADGTGDLWTVLKQEFQVEQYRDYSYQPSLIRDIVNDLRAETELSLLNHTAPILTQLNV